MVVQHAFLEPTNAFQNATTISGLMRMDNAKNVIQGVRAESLVEVVVYVMILLVRAALHLRHVTHVL